MKSKFIILYFLLLGSIGLSAQQEGSAKKTLLDLLQIPAESIKKDQKGNVLTTAQFTDSLYTLKYIFDPVIKNDQITEVKLKPMGPEEIAYKVPEGIQQLIETLDYKPRPAIDFTVTDIKGKKHQLSKLKNKTVVLNFWFTNCLPCVKEIPELNELVKANPDVVFIAFATDKADKLKKFLGKHQFSYHIVPNALDISKKYNIAAYPTHFVIKNGIITHKLIDGENSKQKLQKAINEK
ncbi:TlpA family protein disulfide reductase [Chryseobacterium herbae]|uniref:TlpA family protein disulfide reductase n=1 Tax=Chryseobacterium herbae TaxID=2976476 RepID=A0ABT2IXW3_9FLAO|nr:TlpA disulfide reductase family protein [Chryseobacterium sp. pc1-10]MCT2563336.1 TlpA family protein disulfide reductase [Chryseobacterium sp. pc1-10]